MMTVGSVVWLALTVRHESEWHKRVINRTCTLVLVLLNISSWEPAPYSQDTQSRLVGDKRPWRMSSLVGPPSPCPVWLDAAAAAWEAEFPRSPVCHRAVSNRIFFFKSLSFRMVFHTMMITKAHCTVITCYFSLYWNIEVLGSLSRGSRNAFWMAS